MTSIRTRLDKLEAKLKPDPELSVWEGIANFLTTGELLSILDTYEAGGSLPAEELQRLWLLGYERKNTGISPHDINKVYGETQRVVKGYFRQFLRELADKIGYANVPKDERFDTRHLSAIDIDRLFRLVTSSDHQSLEAFADVIGRLWFDHQPMSVADFESLIRPHGPKRPA